MRGVLLLAAGLSACAPVAAAPPIPSPQPTASVVLPLRLVGTEPFWGVLLKEGTLSFTGVDRGAILAPIARAETAGDRTTFHTAPPSAAMPVSVRATVTPGPCSDGMSDRIYPHTAAVEIDYAGAAPPVRLNGCAGPESLFHPGD